MKVKKLKEFEWIYKTIDNDKSGSYKDEIKYKIDLPLILIVCFMIFINLLFIFQYIIDKNTIGLIIQILYSTVSYYIFKYFVIAMNKIVYNNYSDRNNNYYKYVNYIESKAWNVK